MRFLTTLLSVILFSTMAYAAPVQIKTDVKPSELRSAGDENASATIYAFTSLSCPHCSVYHANVLPEIYKSFVESGQAKVVFVDMPYDARSMMGTMLSRCIKPEQYEAYMSVAFKNQAVWMNSPAPRPIFTGYAKLVGMTDDEINQCLSDKSLQKHITSQRDNLANLYKVTGMPSTVVVKNGKNKKFVGTDTAVLIQNIEKELK